MPKMFAERADGVSNGLAGLFAISGLRLFLATIEIYNGILSASTYFAAIGFAKQDTICIAKLTK